MLYELFSWMSDSAQALPFPQETMSLADFESENQIARSRHRALLADHRIAKMGSDDVLVEAKSLQSVYRHDEFMKFMAFCQKELCQHDQCNSYVLLIAYFLSLESSEPFIPSVTRLFLLLLNENPEQALAFYQNNKKQFKSFQEVNLIMWAIISSAVDTTKAHLADLTPQLSLEENPLTLVPLCQFNDELEKLAALILWLLPRVSVTQILETHLLQNYMSYYLPYLHSDENSIDRLYYLLSQFPAAQALVREAGKTQCEERGFEAYSLTGSRPNPVNLHRIQMVVPSPLLTPTQGNFNALFQLFGFPFLQLAIEGFAAYKDERWHGILHDFLHQDIQQLPRVINLTVTNSPARLEVLANLIDDKAVETLATQHNGAIFHLLPYKPNLLIRLGHCDIEFYLRQVCSAEVPAFEIVSQLMVLFITFRGVNKSSAKLVYEHILDVTLEHREILSDSGLLKILRKFSDKSEFIETRGHQLQERLDTCVSQEVLSGPICVEGYHRLEDTWREVSAKLIALNTISSITYRCPINKYDFQVYLAKEFFSKYGEHFEMSGFFEALEIEQISSVDMINEYEQSLIAILTAIDDPALRDEIISILMSDKAMSKRWMDRDYNGKTVVNRAAQHDNVGLIKWLDSSMDLSHLSVQIIDLAETGRWHVVDYLCRTYHLSQKKLKELVVLAAEAGQDKLVQFLCFDAIDRMQSKTIVLAFIKAAASNHVDLMQFLMDFASEDINTRIITKAFKITAQLQRLQSMDYLGNLMENSSLLYAGESILVHSVVHERLPVIQQLCGLRINAPRLAAVEKAFLRAVECGNLSYARYFSNLSGYVFRQNVIDQGVKISVAHKSFHSLSFMFDLSSYYPSRDAVEYALRKMVKAKCAACVTLLCKLKRNGPRESATEEALLVAIELKSYPNVVYLSSLVSSHALRKSFIWAAQYGSVDILRYYYKVYLLNQRVIQSALQKISGSEQNEMRSYLQGILPFSSRGCLDLFRHPPAVIPSDNVKKIKRHVSTGDLEQCGFFGSKTPIQRYHSSSAESPDLPCFP